MDVRALVTLALFGQVSACQCEWWAWLLLYCVCLCVRARACVKKGVISDSPPSVTPTMLQVSRPSLVPAGLAHDSSLCLRLLVASVISSFFMFITRQQQQQVLAGLLLGVESLCEGGQVWGLRGDRCGV